MESNSLNYSLNLTNLALHPLVNDNHHWSLKRKVAIDLFRKNAIKFGNFTLNSGLSSPFYLDLKGIASHPSLLSEIVDLYLDKIAQENLSFDVVAPIPYTAIPIASLIAQKLGKPLVYFRKEIKDYGTGKLVEGDFLPNDEALIIDDLITTAKSKIEAAEILNSVGLVTKETVVLIDREQGGPGHLQKSGITCHSILTGSELFRVLHQDNYISQQQLDDCLRYTRENGVQKKKAGQSENLMQRAKSIIVSCDVASMESLQNLVTQTTTVVGIGGYKIGLELALRFGLPEVVRTVKELSNLPIIYDHQKAGNDIPAMGGKFAITVAESGIDAAILFPFAGPETEKTWIRSCLEQGLHVIVGAHMTHPGFLDSEGGSLSEKSVEKIFELAVDLGVTDFVVPGNQPQFVLKYKLLFDSLLGKNNFSLFAPGFITQGGEISEMGKVAGDKWHAIIGSALYGSPDVGTTARLLTGPILRA